MPHSKPDPIYSHQHFRRLQGEDALTSYTFNTDFAQHPFCRVCGIKPCYVPRSHPDGLNINVNCLDASSIKSIEESPFDDRDREQNVAKLSLICD